MSTIDLGAKQPGSYKLMHALSRSAEAAAGDAGISDLLIELVKIRASQINGCAYCLRMHTRDARRKGETDDRLAVVAAWWESMYFDEVEQAALALTERITDIADAGPRRAVPVDVEDALDEAQYVAVSWLAIVINAYNRIAITGHLPVAPD